MLATQEIIRATGQLAQLEELLPRWRKVPLYRDALTRLETDLAGQNTAARFRQLPLLGKSAVVMPMFTDLGIGSLRRVWWCGRGTRHRAHRALGRPTPGPSPQRSMRRSTMGMTSAPPHTDDATAMRCR